MGANAEEPVIRETMAPEWRPTSPEALVPSAT